MNGYNKRDMEARQVSFVSVSNAMAVLHSLMTSYIFFSSTWK